MLHGHYWTIRGHLSSRLRPKTMAPSQAWFCSTVDPRVGKVRLTGRLRDKPGSTRLLLVVHGLGGSSQSPYTFRAAAAAERAGLSCLRLNLRGADMLGQDLFHAALTDDIQAALASPELGRFSEVFVLGYSLGGSVSLRYAAAQPDPRVRSIAAVCSPLDLNAGAAAFDAARFSVYRTHVLGGLKQMYQALCKQYPERAPADLATVRAIHKIRDWDEAIVAPRHGFRDAAHYYAESSAGPVLGDIRIPTLVLHTRHDPMVPLETVTPYSRRAKAPVHVMELDVGGHVGFRDDFSLQRNAPLGLESQLVDWLKDPAA